MKKLKLFIALIVVSVFAISCDSDDDNNTTAQPIVGTWEITNVDIYERDVFDGEEEIFEESFSTENCDPKPFFSFSTGGGMTVTEVDFDILIGNEVSCLIEEQLNGNWVFVSNNTYVFTVDNEAVQAQVVFSNGNNNVEVIIDDSDEEGEFLITYRAVRI